MRESKIQIGINMGWNSIGTLFYCGCQWLLTVLVVRLNTDYSDAGILTLAMAFANPVTVLATLNLRTFQVAHMNKQFCDGDFIFVRMVTSLVAFVISVIIVSINNYTPYISGCIILFIFFRLSEAIVDVLHGIDQQVWRLDIVGKSFLLRGIAILVLFIFGQMIFHSLLISIALMAVGVYGVIICYDIPACNRCTQINRKYNRKNLPKLIQVGISLCAFSFLLTLLSTIPRLFVDYWYGEDVLGIIGSITTISSLIPQLASFIFNPLIPIFSDYWKSGKIKLFAVLLFANIIILMLLGSLAILCSFFLGEWVLKILFGASMCAYSYLLVPIILTAIITSFIWLFGMILTVFEDYIKLALISLISVIGCLIASIILVKESAFVGCVIAMCIGLILEFILLGFRILILILRRTKYIKKGVDN